MRGWGERREERGERRRKEEKGGERGAGRREPGATRIRDSFTSSPALRAGR